MRWVLMSCLAACGGTPEPVAPPEPAEPPAEPPAMPPPPDAPPALTLDTAAGPLTVTPVYHGTMVFQAGGQTVWLDPWSRGALDGKPPGDVILITDLHPDHLDAAAISAVAKPDAVLVAPADVAGALEGRTVQHVLANGQEVTIGAWSFTATPMYNLVRGPEEGGKFHDAGRGNGYLIRYGGKTVYVSGDTECTPEMRALTGIDLAFVTMNLPYTMPPEEAADCVKAFKPARVVPYHYAGSDLAVFTTALAGTPEVHVETAEFYPGGLPW
jgi:L-ascorbate metabolism protein UlaG (beta-lactamase superfamily)